MTRYAGVLVLWTWACLSCETAPPALRTLTVITPVAGTVVVGAHTSALSPYQEESIATAEAAPTVTFRTGTQVLTVTQVSGESLDLAPFLGVDPLASNQEVSISFRAPDATDVVVMTHRDVRQPVVDGDLYRVEVPREGAVVLVARWQLSDGRQALGWRSTETVADWADRTLLLSPTAESVGTTVVQVDGAPRGWLRVELVLDGRRTGIVLAEGRVSGQEARASPRFLSSQAPGMTLWVEAEHREIGGEVMARTGAVLAMDTLEAVLPWPQELSLRPALQAPADAAPLDWGGNGLVMAESPSASWIEIELAAVGGCAPDQWQIFMPPTEELVLPSTPPPGLLDAPLLRASVRSVWAQGLSYGDLVGEGGGRLLDRGQAPLSSGFWQSRTVSGYWRGTLPVCNGAFEPTSYAAYDPGGLCSEGGAAPTVLRDRCGALVTLSSPPDLACSLPGETGLESISGAPVEAVEGPANALLVTQGNRVMELVPFPASAGVLPLGWTGRYHRYRVMDEITYADAGADDESLVRPFVVEAGDAEEGPWADLKADGTLEVVTRTTEFTVFFSAFDGVIGYGLRGDPGCKGVGAEHTLTLDGEGLVLELRLPGPEPDQIRWRRLYFAR